MKLFKKLKRELNNIKMLSAYSFLDLAKQLYLFPIDYYLRRSCKSSPAKNIALFVTLRCNARCQMCNLIELLNKEEQRDPSLTQIEQFIGSIAKNKPGIVLFGGEPFVRQDIFEIISLVKSHKLSCGIFTNGLLLNQEKIDKIINLGLNYLVFSLQGIGKGHDKIVQIDGAFDRIVKNIQYSAIQKRKTKTIIHTTISEGNLDQLEEIINLSKKLKVDGLRFGHPTFFTPDEYNKNKIVCQHLFPKEKIKGVSYIYNPIEKGNEFIKKIIDLRRKYGDDISFTPELDENEIKDWYSPTFKSKRKCYFIWRGAFVYPNGDVCPCESFYYPLGNIYQDDFNKIWNNQLYRNFRKILKKGLLPGCARCCKL